MDSRRVSKINILAQRGEDFSVNGSNSGSINSLVEFYDLMLDNKDSIPWLDLEKAGWIEPGRTITSLAPIAHTFVSGNIQKALFRKSKFASDLIVQLWQLKVVLKAKKVFIDGPRTLFSKENFGKHTLYDISRMSPNVDIIKKLPEYLSQYGVILLYEKAIAGIKTDGLVTKLENGVPVIGLTLRYRRLDNFWFTLMHELSHIVLHYDEINTPIVEDFDLDRKNLIEREADKLANDTFVPRKDWNRCPPKYEKTEESIILFAKKMGIHPSIVAGRLQRELDQYTFFRSIVDKVDVQKELGDIL